ncbi:MAG TPA: hypothetical protein PLO89_06505 [Spirochaetota bacterium]|nr:hypothetical protein [Spirochaetota bacterium]
MKIFKFFLFFFTILLFFGCNKGENRFFSLDDNTKIKKKNSDLTNDLANCIAYSYDKSGKILSSSAYDDHGNLICSYFYNSYGKITKNIKYNLSGIVDLIYEYDEKGNKVKESYYVGDNKFYFIKYEYDERGNQLKKESYDESGDLKATANFNSDENINIVSFPDGSSTIYDYKENGVVKETSLSDNGTVKYIYEYDEYKKNKKYSHYDENGNLKSLYEFNDNNNVIKQSIFDDNKNLRSVYEYDENGNRIRIKTFDSQGKEIDYE